MLAAAQRTQNINNVQKNYDINTHINYKSPNVL